MKKIIKVGIAGYGVVGARRRKFIDAHPNLKTVAVCDKKFSSAGELIDGVRSYSHYLDLLKEELDVLFVCLTNDVAAEVTIKGLENKLHVFCEKPPGRNLDDVAQVMAAEKKYPDLKLMYGFNHRYHDSIKEALEVVQSKQLGKVINIRGVYGKSKIINFQSDWRTKREVAGGGILLDQGIHMVDLIRLFVGDIDQIHSFIENSHWNHDVEDNAYALMRSTNGAVVFLNSTATQWRHRFNLEVTMEKGSITLSGILSGTKSYGAETITIAYKAENDGGDPLEVTKRYNQDNSWGDEISDFANAILFDKQLESGTSLEAYKTMELVYRIYCADQAWAERYDLKDYPSQEYK